MRRIFESDEYQNALNDVQKALDGYKIEYGTTGYSINARVGIGSIFFFFDKSLTDSISWGIEKSPNNLSEYSDNVKKALSRNRSKEEYWVALPFAVVEGTNLLEVTVPFGIGKEERIIKSDRLVESVVDIITPFFKWISAINKLHKFSSLDKETLMEYFSDMFDDSEDYSIHVRETMGINLYEVVVSTKTVNRSDEGGFVVIDDDVMTMFRDLPNVIKHIQSEYPVKISINTSKPSREKHPDKSETFYKSQAFILRIIPTLK